MEKQNNEQVKRSKEGIFYFVKDESGKVVIVCGGMQASKEKFKTFEQAEKYVSLKPYELIFNTFFIMQKHYEEDQKTSESDTKNAE